MKNLGTIAAAVIIFGAGAFGAGFITGISANEPRFAKTNLIRIDNTDKSVRLYTEPSCSDDAASGDARTFMELFSDTTAVYTIYKTQISSINWCN